MEMQLSQIIDRITLQAVQKFRKAVSLHKWDNKNSNRTFVCIRTTKSCIEWIIPSMFRSSSSWISKLMNSLTWLMESSVWKWATLPIAKTSNTSIYQYSIFDESSERRDDHNYLGLQHLMIFIGMSIAIW